MPSLKFQGAQTGAAIAVKVTANASQDAVAGVMSDGTIRIRLKAKAIEGAANEALIGLLAGRLRVSRSQIEIVAGKSNTRKLVSILGLSPAEVEARLVPKSYTSESARRPAKK